MAKRAIRYGTTPYYSIKTIRLHRMSLSGHLEFEVQVKQLTPEGKSYPFEWIYKADWENNPSFITAEKKYREAVSLLSCESYFFIDSRALGFSLAVNNICLKCILFY